MVNYDIDAYNTDLGWVARATRLDRYGQDERVFCAGLGSEDDTEQKAIQRGVRWVHSRGDRIRRTTSQTLGLFM